MTPPRPPIHPLETSQNPPDPAHNSTEAQLTPPTPRPDPPDNPQTYHRPPKPSRHPPENLQTPLRHFPTTDIPTDTSPDTSPHTPQTASRSPFCEKSKMDSATRLSNY